LIDSLIEEETLVPLFQISLLPDLTHVNLSDLTVSVAPTLVHFAPALAAANDEGTLITVKAEISKVIRIFLMPKTYRFLGALTPYVLAVSNKENLF
jgi:hypothetical protein